MAAPERKPRLDNELLSVVLFSSVAAVLITVITNYAGHQITHDMARFVVWGVILLVLVISVLFEIMAFFMMSKKKKCSTAPESETYMRLTFLWLCGLVMTLYPVFAIVRVVDCVWKIHYNTTYAVCSVLTYVLYTLFYILQMVLVTYNRFRRMHSSFLSRGCIAITSMANLTIWTNSFVSDVYGLYSQTHFNLSGSALKNEIQCQINSSINSEFLKVLPYLIPYRLEFSVMATILLCRLWPSEYGSNENRTTDNRVSNMLSGYSAFGFVFGIFMAFPIFLSCVGKFAFKKNIELVFLTKEWGFLLTNINSFCFIIWLTYATRNRQNTQPVSAGLNTYLLILSLMGVFAFSMINTTKSIFSVAGPSNVHLAREISTLVTSFYQTQLLLKLKGSACGRVSEKAVCLVLLVYNISLWIHNTMTGYSKLTVSQHTKETFTPHTLTIIRHVLVPLCALFHFQSGIEFYALSK